MKTKNAMQLKALIKNRAEKETSTPQLVMQNYLLERLLERISSSRWRDYVVVKGGMLISSLIGVSKRSTKDLDTTIRGFPLTHENAKKAFEEIIATEVNDDFEFEFVKTEDIRGLDEYPGVRVFLLAKYEKLSVPLTVDVTTGDKITPEVVEYNYPLLFDDRSISLMTYPLVTIFAEKLECVISRGVTNTRPRDYYDIFTLYKTRGAQIDFSLLKEALKATAKKRKTLSAFDNYQNIMEQVAADSIMQNHWKTYAQKYPYVGNLTFQETCEVVVELMDATGW